MFNFILEYLKNKRFKIQNHSIESVSESKPLLRAVLKRSVRQGTRRVGDAKTNRSSSDE
jgi:hypothetical protein